MTLTGLQINFVLVFFIYGLAFFTMGIAMLLEAGRSPLLAEARVLRPLAAFGLLHGIHEWIEIFLLQADWLSYQYPEWYSGVRLSVLALSFTSLIAFGVQVFRPPRRLAAVDALVGLAMLLFYAGALLLSGGVPWKTSQHWVELADAVARYSLAVPGALLAALALHHHSGQVKVQNQQALNRSLHAAAVGFALYGLTQLLVSPLELFPARYLNAAWFFRTLGIPVQVVRALLALVVTAGLIRATQVVDKERQRQLIAAKQARLEALERVQDALVKREELRRQLLRHTVVAQEEERARISRELHDETAQALTAFSVNLAALKNLLPPKAEVEEIFTRLQTISDQIAKRLHRLVHDLHPAQLDDLGLAPALGFLVDETQKSFGLEVSLHIYGTPCRLDSFVETVLYRIVQEALTNVARHAQTRVAEVGLCFEPAQVSLRVEDQGVGFDPVEAASSPLGLGLAGMRERVESVGGTFHVRSAPARGTLIEVKVPLQTSISPRKGEIALWN